MGLSLGLAGLSLGAVMVMIPPSEGSAPEPEPRRPYADGPPLAYTGGFGEPTCRECHFDNPPGGEGGGSLDVRGFPEEFRPGDVHLLTVALARPGMERAGFQLSVRYDSGPGRGRSAGELEPAAARSRPPAVEAVWDDEGRVVYGRQTLAGSELSWPAGDSTAWTLRWRAPSACVPVVLHVAANAANGDESEFGDHVYRDQLTATQGCPSKNRPASGPGAPEASYSPTVRPTEASGPG